MRPTLGETLRPSLDRGGKRTGWVTSRTKMNKEVPTKMYKSCCMNPHHFYSCVNLSFFSSVAGTTSCGMRQTSQGSRLCRSQIVQVNMRLKALAEIYKMHSFAPFWNRIRSLSSIFCLKIAKNVALFCQIAKFVKISLEFVDFRADFYRNFTKSCRINKNYQIFAENCEICEI